MVARINASWVWAAVFVVALVQPASTGPLDDLFLSPPASAPLPPPKIGFVSTGTGFVVNSHGYVLTNEHVVCDCTDVRVHIGGEERPAQVLHSDPDRDIALLKIDANDLTAVELGDSGALRNGATVYAMGCPLGICGTVTQGRVANPAVRVGDISFIMMDLTITHGNSGGPLVDEYGRVVGITSAGLKASEDETSGFSLAVPINEALEILERVPGLEAAGASGTAAGVLGFSEVEAIVGPATAYIEADRTRTLELPESYLPPTYGGFLGVRGGLGPVADAFPGSIVRGIEGSRDEQSWEGSEFQYSFVGTLSSSTTVRRFSDRVAFDDTASAMILEAVSASETRWAAETFMQGGFGYTVLDNLETLSTASEETNGVLVLSSLVFDSLWGGIGGAEDAVCILRYSAAAVVDRFIIYFSAKRRLRADVGDFQVDENTVVLHIDEGNYLSVPKPFSVHVDCMPIRHFTDQAIDEANAVFAFVLQQF